MRVIPDVAALHPGKFVDIAGENAETWKYPPVEPPVMGVVISQWSTAQTERPR